MTILEIDNLTRAFSGFKAVADVDFSLAAGELRGLIGSNGAGKSTLLDLIYGRQEADAGTITFAGDDVTLIPAGERARRGMGLVFQIANLFGDLTVDQNLRLGALPKRPGSRIRLDIDEVDRVLDLIELADSRTERAANLSHGARQWLEIGMVLLTRPRLLLLDEPTSGMTRSESRRTAQLLRRLMADGAVESMVVVEHNIEFISLVSDRVTVMHRGSILAEGTVAEVKANQEVQAAYLGRLH